MRRGAGGAWAILMVTGLCGLAHAEPGQSHLVAVLPLAAPKLDKDLRDTLEEDIRTVAGNYLSPRGYTILTGDNTLELLADNNVDASKVCDATCALKAAREMKATIFVSGSATKAEGEYIAFVRLFESTSGRQLASVKLEGGKVKELREQFESKAPDLFASVVGQSGKGAPAAPTGDDQARLDEANAKVAREKAELEAEKAELEATRLEAEKAKLASEKAELAAKLARQKAAPVVASVATSDSGDTFQAAGHEWQTKPAANTMNWEAAKSYCAGQGGGWRLPDKDELKALYDAKQSSSEIASKPGMAGGWYWSSTPGENGGAWNVSFGYGHVYALNVYGSNDVRCVR
jgi:hypothetical protein